MWICKRVSDNTIIESQSASGNALLQNAINAGYTVDDVVVLEVTDAEYAATIAPSAATLRAQEIRTRLLEIDFAGIRAVRAAVAGTATADDTARLAALESEAAGLRKELVGQP